DSVATKKKVKHLPVGVSKCMFGFKEAADAIGKKGDAALKQECVTNILLEALFGNGAEFYRSLYDEGLIDEQFGFDYTLEDGFGFTIIGGDTPDPERLIERVEDEIPKFVDKGLTEEEFH